MACFLTSPDESRLALALARVNFSTVRRNKRKELPMKVKLAATLLTLLLCGSNTIGRNEVLQQAINPVSTQTITLYPPHDKITGKYDETRACFSFKMGRNKLQNSTDWDLGYGFASINNEDWLMVGTTGRDKRSVMKEIGNYNWSDSFKIPAIEPLPELKEGERRQITVDSSADTHQKWAETTSQFAKAKAGYMYLVHVKDAQADFYALFRVEEIGQGDHCTISWALIPAPEKSTTDKTSASTL